MYLKYIITDNFKIAIVSVKKVKNIMKLILNLIFYLIFSCVKLILNQYVISICVQNSFYSCENCPVLN